LCLLAFAAAVLTSFIAGLLFISCAYFLASSTSITWEPAASGLETGLLISSVIANHGNLDVRRGVLEPVSSLSREGRSLLSN